MRTLLKFIIVLLLSSSLFGAKEKISLQLEWLHQFQFAGYYIAKERGYYEAIGLDVTIKEMTPKTNVVKEVVSQKAQYGIGRSSLLVNRAEGSPIVLLGAIFQRSPSVLISTNPKIKTLKDLNHKNIMITNDVANGATIKAMLLSKGLLYDNINFQQHSFKIKDLINGKTDAMACYLSNEPFFLERAGIPYKVFDPRDYGFDFYEDIIFTSEDELKNHPERAEAFYKASIEGWKWAFEHIEETAKIIHDKYNSQNKSIESLIYEGKILKKLALNKNGDIGTISLKQIDKIVNWYRVTGLLEQKFDFTPYIDPSGYNKKRLNIGILAKRGGAKTLERWEPLATYLNRSLEEYHVVIHPLSFDEIEEHLKKKSIDFLLVNSVNYVQLENQYGISRIATLKSKCLKKKTCSYFGGVIFTSKESKVKNIEMVKGRKFAAVNEDSFGGWIMAYELLHDRGMDVDDIKLKFYDTHDAVVYAVLNSQAEIGTVRSDTLEHLAKEKQIDLENIRILNTQQYQDFPYATSTKLYPEWPFAKLKHVPENTAKEVMTALINMPENSPEAIAADIGGWTVPLDYSSVHEVLKKLHLQPYDKVEITPFDVLKKYAIWIYVFISILIVGIIQFLHIRRVNLELDRKVHERTEELYEANNRLKELAHTDALTGIHNRGYFMELAEQLFKVAKRNNSPFQLLSLDIDYFKDVNDTYGHQVGDEVLKLFADKIGSLLRESDIFGRIGGEEFVICLQNTTHEGALLFAEKILKEIRALQYINNKGESISFTVSIGVAELQGDKTLLQLLRESDEALYRAKEAGRDRVES
ncbi:ABC transporter substrate-binding protein [Sulfurimonas microaerophilic]|uniref:ABC transporter substrate-binding protein n=1 Tax=Sulfurimonas microaerophilic TaxID=3058392 RepID=UPI00271454B4|nr:ABC transporter substrate-binding protein [Sulfurimonas sp. hsl 1-7]